MTMASLSMLLAMMSLTKRPMMARFPRPAPRTTAAGISVFRIMPGLDAVLEVAAQIGDTVNHSHQTPFERGGQSVALVNVLQLREVARAVRSPLPVEAFPAMRDDPVAHLVGEVEPRAIIGELVHHAQPVDLVLEALAERRGPSANLSSTRSPAWPNGGWPRSCPLAMALMRSMLRLRHRPIT